MSLAFAATEIERARDVFFDKVAAAQIFLGHDVANDVIERLQDDVDHQRGDPPPGYSAVEWSDALSNAFRLDEELVAQVVSATPRSVAEIRGLHETFVRSMQDGTNQPVAVYVPSTYDPAKPAPLVVALHGRPQTETALLGGVVIRGMAEASGAIAIAPWGRGNYDFAEPAGSEVYEAVDAVTHALAIDPQRIYLTGYSMGGFSVYNVAPLRCNRWAGIMSIAGAIVNSKTAAYLERCANVKLYIVNGANDDSIPPKYGEQSAAFLTGKGLRVSFYQEPHGTHYLRSLEPALKRAWGDMLAGSVHPVLSRSAPLEEPPTMMKPTHPY